VRENPQTAGEAFMKKQPSIKQMALRVVQKRITRWQDELSADDPHMQFDINSFKYRLGSWIEKVSNVTFETIEDAAKADRRVEIDGEFYLPSDLSIVKQYHATAAAAPLVDAYDKNKSHHIPIEKLFTPSLFPKLDYDDARGQWVILGETQRVTVGSCSPFQWLQNDRIDDANYEAQVESRKGKLVHRKKRIKLFGMNDDCISTDALMKKLGAWKG
jgi:hypothetical protein